MPSGNLLRPALILLGAAAAAGLVHADNWPRFRGHGTGAAADKDIPVIWNQKSVLWKRRSRRRQLLARGPGRPPVRADGLGRRQGEAVALPVRGRRQAALVASRPPAGYAKIHARNTLASSSPAADGERVYASFWDGKDVSLTAYDFDGKLLWTRNLGGFTSRHAPAPRRSCAGTR